MARDPYRIDVYHQRRAAYRLVIVAGVIFVMSLMGKNARERAEAQAEEAGVAPPASGSSLDETPPAVVPEPAQSRWRPEPGARTRVPRPELPTRTQSAFAAPSSVDTGAEDAALRAALGDSLAAVVPDVRDCLHQWWMMDPSLAGEVELEFVLTAQGLSEVEVLDHSEVPMGPLSCFATALYDAEWPQVADQVVVRQPFRFEN